MDGHLSVRTCRRVIFLTNIQLDIASIAISWMVWEKGISVKIIFVAMALAFAFATGMAITTIFAQITS
jgi:hypothetical protein